jgi:hypothetical protein
MFKRLRPYIFDAHTNVRENRTEAKTVHRQQNSHKHRNNETKLDIWNTTVRYGSHFKHRYLRTIPNQTFVYDSRRSLVRAEWGYPKGSPKTNR